ncbi:MAG: sigma-70 family RNA polymerase sigma factor [Clostridiales bacterium]|nr:sigma-70 family RNA polymerase sigma factor [Clostridiales bacterium]
MRLYQETGDQSYFEALLEQNRGLLFEAVRRVLAKFPKADPEDLEAEARLGMWVAAQRFDARRGASFAHVATIWMRKQLMAQAHRYNGVVYFPSGRAKEIRKIHSKASAATIEEGREVTAEEIVAREGYSDRDREWLKNYSYLYDPLQLNWSPDPREMPDFVAAVEDGDAALALEDVLMEVDLEALMATLTVHERLCLRRRMEGYTVKEIAHELGKPPYFVKAVLNQIRVKLSHPARWGFAKG